MTQGNDIGSGPIEWCVEFTEALPPFEEQMKFSIETVTKTFQISGQLIGANDNDNRYQPTGPVVDSTMARGGHQ